MKAARADGWHSWILAGVAMAMVCAWVLFTFVMPPSPADRWRRMLATIGTLGVFVSSAAMLTAVRAEALPEQTWWTTTIVVLGLAATASVGRPKDELGALGTFIGAVAATLVSLRYFLERHETRQRERRQRQDALFADWTKLVSDKQSCRVIHMLEKDDPELEKLGKMLLQLEYDGWKHPLDQMLEQLQRLSFAVAGGDVDEGSANQIAGWYFGKVVARNALRQYCEMHGFKPLVDFANELVRKELERLRVST